MLEERRSMIFDQLDKLTSRARLLQRSMTVFYVALGIFVATSFSIGVFAVTGGTDYSWVPVILALSGASCLFYGSILLIFEARLALSALHAEMDFLWKLGQYYAPAKLREQSREQNLLARIPFIKSGERGESDR